MIIAVFLTIMALVPYIWYYLLKDKMFDQYTELNRVINKFTSNDCEIELTKTFGGFCSTLSDENFSSHHNYKPKSGRRYVSHYINNKCYKKENNAKSVLKYPISEKKKYYIGMKYT